MNIKFSRKEKFLIVFYLFMILFLGVGISLSFFLLADSAPKDSTKVYAGTIEINYIQGSRIYTEKLEPIPEPDFNTTEKIYRNEFVVKTTGTLEQSVQIGFDISKNQFSTDSLRYAFYTEAGEKISTGYLNEGHVIFADNLYFEANESRKYVFIIWLEEKPYDQSHDQGCLLTGKMNINSKQFGY